MSIFSDVSEPFPPIPNLRNCGLADSDSESWCGVLIFSKSLESWKWGSKIFACNVVFYNRKLTKNTILGAKPLKKSRALRAWYYFFCLRRIHTFRRWNLNFFQLQISNSDAGFYFIFRQQLRPLIINKGFKLISVAV